MFKVLNLLVEEHSNWLLTQFPHVLLFGILETPAKGHFLSNGYFSFLTLLMLYPFQKTSFRATQSDNPFGMEVLMTDKATRQHSLTLACLD